MTTEKLLEKLREQRNSIDSTIRTIESILDGGLRKSKAKAIIKSVGKKWSKAQREKFRATMKKKYPDGVGAAKKG